MKKLFCLTIAIFTCVLFAFGQASVKYFEYVNQAKNYFEKKDYKKSSISYANAFKLNAGKAYWEDRYDAARAWTMAGNKDSAFVQLFKVATLYDYINYTELSNDHVFTPMKTDKRWTDLLDIVKKNIGETDVNLNRGLVILLDSVYRAHHSLRLKEINIRNEFGADSKESNEIKKQIKGKDSINIKIVESVLVKYGWLGKEVVGFIGNYAIILIIQNADLTLQEKYLAMAREAFKSGKIDVYDFALLEDKVTLRQGKKQVYGSVIINFNDKNYVAPVEDEANLDRRRADLGLKSMNNYLSNWGIKWNLSKYKKDLLLLEKEQIQY